MSRLNRCFVLAGFLLMGSCAAPPPPPPSFADIRFTSEPPINLDVSSVGLYATFQPSNQLPEIEGQFPVTPENAFGSWVHDRLIANNPTSTAIARVTILDAIVKQVTLQKPTSGIEGAFTKDQAYSYEGHIAAKIEIYDKGLAVRTASVEASLSRSIAEGSTLNQREQLWYDMAHDLAENLGRSMTAQIQGSFAPYAQVQ